MIQRLGSDVISELRSGVALSGLSQCVEELVLNSVDAGSSSITVDVNIPTMFLEVSDNGSGMRQSDLKNVGQRYFTSKCHSLHDLHNANSYGFRGEALASLGKICQKIEIISRHKTSGRTFYKCFRKGWDVGVYESTSLRPRHGTTIKALGVFYALPVRQKLISEKVDLEQIRRHVMGIALMNAGVSFLVRNKENGTSILQINACSSALSVLSQVFGCHKSKAFKSVFLTSGAYTVTGYVNLEGYPNRNFQYFYVNKRLVLKTKFHHLANHILGRAVAGIVMIDHMSTNQDLKSSSPKKMGRYAGFVINLECPYNAYDITFDPKKTLVEFQNWHEPISCLRGCLFDFLKKEGIFIDEFLNTQSDSQESCPGLSEEYDLAEVDSESSMEYLNGMKRPIKASDLRGSLCSSTAKRKRNENAIFETGDLCSSENSCKPNESGNVTTMDWTSKTEDMVLCEDCPFGSDAFSAANNKRDISLYSHFGESLVNERENSSKRSIITKLQRYSADISRPGNVCLSDSTPTFGSSANSCRKQPASKKTAEIDDNKVESLKSEGVERKCREMSGKVSKVTDVCFERKIIPSAQFNDCKTLLVADHHEMGIVDTTISITQDKPPITKSRNVPLTAVNFSVTSPTAEHCSVVEANITRHNQWCLKDSRMLGFRDENNSDFLPEASTHTLTNENSVMAKADATGPTTCNNATTDTADESQLLRGSDWLLQQNPRDGRPLYVNLRTGNTSMTLSNTKPPPRIPLLKKQTISTEQTVDMTKPRTFRNYASHLSHNFTPWLPRSVAPNKNCNVSKSEDKKSSEIRDMFDQWVNPVFEKNEKLIMDASFTESSKLWIKPHSRLQPFKFTKECFSKMKVINQVDNKFILCYYKGSEGNNDGFLVAVDQHAAHERVRLETFIQDLYADSQDPGDKMVMKSSPLSTPCKLSMSDHDVHLMQAFRVQLAQVGITFEDLPRSSSDVQSSVCIKTVPSVFLAREYSNDGEQLRDEIKKCIEDLVKEQIEEMLSTKGTQTTALPKAITKVLNSQACHGAIRFGDSLSTEECVNLMASLSTCNLPFQCAHGRPSMIPLMNTQLTHQIAISKKVTNSPQISRIRRLIKGKII